MNLTKLSGLQRLFDLGHFRNPKYPNGFDVKRHGLALLKTSDRVVKDAVTSFASVMASESRAVHQRNRSIGKVEHGIFGGIIDTLLGAKRCEVPDFPLTENLRTGTGSWPPPCQKNGVTVGIDRSRMPAKFRATFDGEVRDACFAAYAKLGLKLVEHPHTTDCNIDVYWTSLSGSTIGLAEFPSGSCSDNVFCRLDQTYEPNTATLASLLLHELGHNMGLNHTSGGIMAPTITNVNTFTGWKTSDPSYNTLVRFFGGEPIDVPPPNPPAPPVPPLPPIPPVLGVPDEMSWTIGATTYRFRRV